MSTLPSSPMMRALAAAVRANVPTLLVGHPGEAKSATITSHARQWGYHCETITGANRDPSDFLGVMVEADGEVFYSQMAWAKRLNAADQSILFLDELSTAAPSVQKAMLRVLQERWVGDHQLADTVSIIAAANPTESAADGWDLLTPVANRLMHLPWHFDADGWLTNVVSGFAGATAPDMGSLIGGGSESHRIAVKARVAAFLSGHRDLLNPGPPSDDEGASGAWPSPRSWTNAMEVLSWLRPDDDQAEMLVLVGCVGRAAALAHLAWSAEQPLVDPVALLEDPNLLAWARVRPDQAFAALSSLGALVVQRGDAETWGKGLDVLVAVAAANRPDYAVPTLNLLLANRPSTVRGIPEHVRRAFTELMVRTGTLTAA